MEINEQTLQVLQQQNKQAMQNYIESTESCGYLDCGDDTILVFEKEDQFVMIGKTHNDDYSLSAFYKPVIKNGTVVKQGDWAARTMCEGTLRECLSMLCLVEPDIFCKAYH